jgi:hypothetical protein
MLERQTAGYCASRTILTICEDEKMFFRKREPGERRTVKGFAFFPVYARNGTVWLERYELLQSWDARHYCWINEVILTTAST